MPNTVDEAVEWARLGALAVPRRITVRRVTGERFDRILKVEYGGVPEMTGKLMFALETPLPRRISAAGGVRRHTVRHFRFLPSTFNFYRSKGL